MRLKLRYQPQPGKYWHWQRIRHRLWLTTRLFGVDYENCSPLFRSRSCCWLFPPFYLAWDHWVHPAKNVAESRRRLRVVTVPLRYADESWETCVLATRFGSAML